MYALIAIVVQTLLQQRHRHGGFSLFGGTWRNAYLAVGAGASHRP